MNRNDRIANPTEQERVHGGTDTRDLDRVIDHTLRPVKRLSFFERETALALGKSLDSQGHIDLSEAANQTSYQGTGRQNRNAITGAAPHPSEFSEGDLGRHGRFCKNASGQDIQGRNCSVCHGIGFNAYAALRVAKAAGNNLNQARHEMPGEASDGAYAPPNEAFGHV
jgi:hypothetical protein